MKISLSFSTVSSVLRMSKKRGFSLNLWVRRMGMLGGMMVGLSWRPLGRSIAGAPLGSILGCSGGGGGVGNGTFTFSSVSRTS